MPHPQVAVYNDSDRFVAAWLRQLIAAGQITNGKVLEQPIAHLKPEDVTGFSRVHLFAGIGGWDLALTAAAWPSHLPVWTASLPCQPWTKIGTRQKTTDPRDEQTYPEFLRLVTQCRPFVIFGEQVPAAYKWGWLERLSTDLANAHYAMGCTILGAHSAGAPHRRQRIYWTAIDAMGDAHSPGLERPGENVNGPAAQKQPPQRTQTARPTGAASAASNAAKLGSVPLLPRLLVQHPSNTRSQLRLSGHHRKPNRPVLSAWSNSTTIELRDGTRRRAEPDSCPLAYGVPCLVGRVRGYGNAIVPQTAEIFVRAVLDLFHPNPELTDE
jgi:DNA (cytosine-5)-methyltransferase 1